jgi:hypothetical protein
MGQEVLLAEDTLMDDSVANSRFFFLMDINGGVGGYDKLSMYTRALPSPADTSGYACFLGVEVGLKMRSVGVTYHLEALWSPIKTIFDGNNYLAQGDRIRHGVKVFSQVVREGFMVSPEGGYIFVRETARILDDSGGEIDWFSQNYKDRNYCYGLSVRAKVIPIQKDGLWLYGRYVHDHLDIMTDNYWFEAQLGGVNPDPPWVDKERPYAESAFISLGVRWAKRTDGRSEWFLTIGYAFSIGLL